MTRFRVYSNDKSRRGGFERPLHVVLKSMSSWLQGLLALLFADDPSGTPTGPTPRPKAGALYRGARLSERTDAIARRRAA